MSENVSSNNLTGLYGSGGTPIPNANADVIVRGDLWVLSGNILTTATTGNIFPTNATTINLGTAATTMNIGANTGTTTINNNLSVDGTGTFAGDITATGGDFGNITVGITTNNTIDTTTGDLLLSAAGGEIGIIGVGTLYTDQSSFLLLNSPTTITAFDSATSLTMGETTGTTTIRNDLTVQGTGTFTGDITATGGDFGNVTVGLTSDNTINTTTGALFLSSNNGDIGLISVNQLYTDQASFQLLITPTSVGAFTGATSLVMGATTGVSTIRNDLTIEGNDLNLAQSTAINYDENNDRANRPEVKSTTGNSSGFRVLAPNSTTSASANLTVFGSDDINNGEFMSLQATGSTTIPFGVRIGKYTGGVLGASGEEINFSDAGSVFAAINPAGPTNNLDLTTKAYVDALTVGVSSVTGGTHVSASPTTGAVVVTTDATDANTASTIVARDASGNFSAGAGTFTSVITPAIQGGGVPLLITGGAVAPSALTLDDYQTTLALDGGVGYGDSILTTAFNTLTWDHTAGGSDPGSVNGIWNWNSDGTTDFPNYTFPYADGTANQILKTDGTGNLSWFTPADLNTTYDFNATSSTGGANLNLVGSDATTDTVKLTDGGHITATYTSGTAITLGSDATDANTASTIVARDGSGNFAASGATLGNVTVGVDTDQTISTTSGDLVLQTAAGVNAGTITLNSGVNGNIVIAPNGTGDVHLNSDAIRIGDLNATATLATRGTGNLVLTTNEGSVVEGTITIANGANGNITLAPNGTGIVSSGLTQVATASRALGQMYGTQSTTWTPPATGQTTMTGQNGFYASSSSGGANGFGSTIQSRYYSGDTTLGTSTTATFVGGAATGTNAAPAALASGQVLMSLNADAYATTGWASTIATGTQTPTGVAIAPAQLQFYSREAFADNGTNVTAGGTGMRVRLFNAATTYTAANRLTIVDHTTTTATYKAATFNIQPAASTNNYAVFSTTTGSINQDTFTIKNNAATSTQATFNSTGAIFGSGSSTYASFTSSSSSLGYVDSTVLLDRTTAGTPGVANQKNAFTIESRRSDQAGVTDADQTGNAFRVGGTGNFYWTNQVLSQYDTSGVHEYTIQAADGDQTSGSPSWLSLTTFTPTSTVIRAGTAGSGGATATKLTVDATKITAAVPVVFPTYTVAAAGAITGAAGWQISISNSTGNGGRMAYWDTTNARWNYVSDDTAI